MNTSDRQLIILSKNPEAGMVKTRLAKSIGEENALEIYEILRQHTARVAEKVDAKRVVFFFPLYPLFRSFFER